MPQDMVARSRSDGALLRIRKVTVGQAPSLYHPKRLLL